MSTSAWLRAMGAVRPMAVASEEVLVLGEWCQGQYPITWTRYYDRISRDFNGNLFNREPIEMWCLFGHQMIIGSKLTQADCERILSQLRSDDEADTK